MFGKCAAVKVLHEHLVRDDQIAARFLREGRVAARLHHAHILDVIDVGHDGGTAWLVMEFLEGHDLREELERAHRLTPEEAVAYLLPIASALAYAHRVGAVHRDLKPANVFLGRDERDRILPKVVDFGLSKLEDIPESRPLTDTDMVAGSVAYMAPEQTYGIAKAGPPADQFSFACILYESLVGRAPFRGRTFFELIERVRAAKVAPASSEVPSLPTAIDAILARALSVDPGHRFPNMSALGSELLAVADPSTREAWRDEFVDEPRRAGRLVASPRRVRAAPASVDTAPTEPTTSPRLPCPAGASPFQIKGLPYRGLAYYVSRALRGGLEELSEALEDPSLREFIRQPFLASSRYDVLPMRPIMATLAPMVGRSFVDLVRVQTAAQARYDARTVFRQMFGAATLDSWHERVTRHGVQYYTFGRLEGTAIAQGVVLMRHEGVPEYLAPWYAPMQAMYAEQTVRILGGKNVTSELLPWQPFGDVDGLPTLVTGSKILWE
jgi:eukaryotic-like serine/threonine-protein kinase